MKSRGRTIYVKYESERDLESSVKGLNNLNNRKLKGGCIIASGRGEMGLCYRIVRTSPTKYNGNQP